MADIQNKEKTIKLRKQGKSLSEISKILKKPKSTISYWCKNVKLTKLQKAHLLQMQKNIGIRKCIQNAERIHIEYIKNAKKHKALGFDSIKKLSSHDLNLIALGLYWGEGYKKGTNELGFTNSDPDIIKTYILWLQKVHKVVKERIILRVSINNIHKHRAQKVVDYWSKLTGIPKTQFTKTSFIQARCKKVYSNKNEHFGTLRVKVRGASMLRHYVIGSIQKITELSM